MSYNVEEYLAKKAEECTDIETDVRRDHTAKYLGADYEGTWRVFGVPVKITKKNGTVETKLQLFYVKGAVIAADGSVSFDGTETVDPIVEDYADYSPSETEEFKEEVETYMQEQFAGNPASVVISSIDANVKFAICTVYETTDDGTSSAQYYVTDDGDGLSHSVYNG